jgi:hypothetical protein
MNYYAVYANLVGHEVDDESPLIRDSEAASMAITDAVLEYLKIRLALLRWA